MPAITRAARRLFERHLSAIQRAIRGTCARHFLTYDMAEEFHSWAFVKLLENDCRILRRFRGESSWPTYLGVVVQRLFMDFRIHKWGRWRPSTDAKRLGTSAVQIETLTHRDGFELGEAIEMMVADAGVTETREQLYDLAARLPIRLRRSFVSEDVIEPLPAAEATDIRVQQRERARAAREVENCMTEAMACLDPEDRLVLKLHFEDGVTVTRIAELLDIDRRVLYRRVAKLLRTLRQHLDAMNVDFDLAERAFAVEMSIDYGVAVSSSAGSRRGEEVA